MELVEKFCNKCQKIKPISEWPKNRHNKDGLHHNCKECWNNYTYERNKNNKRTRNPKWRRKFIVVAHYSMGEMCCRRCRNPDIRVLCVDHINGNGAEHRKEIKSYDLYGWLIKNDFPEGFQILCFNCNQLKRLENQEFGGKKCSSRWRKENNYQKQDT